MDAVLHSILNTRYTTREREYTKEQSRAEQSAWMRSFSASDSGASLALCGLFLSFFSLCLWLGSRSGLFTLLLFYFIGFLALFF